MVADEIESVLPESTSLDPTGYLTVNYNAAIALLIEAVKQQDEIIQRLVALL